MSIRPWALTLLLGNLVAGVGCDNPAPAPSTTSAPPPAATVTPPSATPALTSAVNAAIAVPAPSKAENGSKAALPTNPTETPRAGDAASSGPPGRAARPPIVPLQIHEAKQRAMASANGGNLLAAIKLLEEGLKASPQDRVGLYLLAAIANDYASSIPPEQAQERSNFAHTSVEAVKTLSATYTTLNQNESLVASHAFLGQAAILASKGKAEEAKSAIRSAAGFGFEEFSRIDSEKDFESFRKLPGYDAFKKELTDKADNAAKERAKALFAQSKSFPFDFDLKDLDDKPVKLADFKGKVTIVNFWGTWCGPCRLELPQFLEFYRKYKDKGLEIIGVNYENVPDDPAKQAIRQFLTDVKVPYKLVLGDDATKEKVPDFKAFPTTLFIDRSGKVRATFVGFNEDFTRMFHDIIRTLLDEPAPSQ